MANDPITFKAGDTGGMRLQKVIRRQWQGNTPEAIESYKQSLMKGEEGEYYFSENVEDSSYYGALDLNFYGGFAALVQQKEKPIPYTVFDASTWFDGSPDKTLLPFVPKAAGPFAKTVGYLDWRDEDNYKLWEVTDSDSVRGRLKMLLLTCGGRDEELVREFNGIEGAVPFLELDVYDNEWLSRVPKGGWKYRNYSNYNMPWLKLAVISRQVRVENVANWEPIDPMDA